MNTRYDKILEFILKLSLEFHAKLLEAMLIDSAIRLLKFDKLISAAGKDMIHFFAITFPYRDGLVNAYQIYFLFRKLLHFVYGNYERTVYS